MVFRESMRSGLDVTKLPRPYRCGSSQYSCRSGWHRAKIPQRGPQEKCPENHLKPGKPDFSRVAKSWTSCLLFQDPGIGFLKLACNGPLKILLAKNLLTDLNQLPNLLVSCFFRADQNSEPLHSWRRVSFRASFVTRASFRKSERLRLSSLVGTPTLSTPLDRWGGDRAWKSLQTG